MGLSVAGEAYDVFVSYARADSRHAADIDSVLRAKGLKSFFDRRDLAPGLPWIAALEQAIGAARAVIVLIGPRGLGNTQHYECDLAIVRQSRDPSFHVVPVILPAAATDRPFDFWNLFTFVDFSHVARVADAPEEIQRLLSAVRGATSPTDVAREPICPYRGLDAFREEDAAFFLGRGSASEPESPIGRLVRKVREHPFVMVVGRSGSGKSSLVTAGLLPALRRERDRFWTVLSLRPGRQPLRALAAAFNPRREDEGAASYQARIGVLADQLRSRDPALLSHMIRDELERAEGKPDRLLLHIDQWEELYAQAPPRSDKERAAQHAAEVDRFIDLLLAAARTVPVAIVATVRADFYDPLIAHHEIRQLLPTRQVLLGSIPRAELERTIVEPARKVGLGFDPPSLVQHILDEAGEDEGMLPLLQHALQETWALREGNLMTAGSYARSGGVRDAIRIRAERAFESRSAEEQQAARTLFRGWTDASREKLRARAAVVQAEAGRKQTGRQDDMLLPASHQLERARGLLDDPGDITTDDLEAFVSSSLAREEAARQKATEMLRRQVRNRNYAIAAVSMLALVSGGLFWRAEQQRAMAETLQGKADESHKIAQSQKEQVDYILASTTKLIRNTENQLDVGTRKELFKLFTTGAHQGDTTSMAVLGWLYTFGRGIPHDYTKARVWLEKAAANGNAAAMSHIGWLHDKGLGVAQDHAEAREWYVKAAERGDAAGMTNLGALYENGRGVAQDYTKAREWYAKAAGKGDADAMFNLGWLYNDGHGVAKDYTKAHEWYEKAAGKGSAAAMNNLGWLYHNGWGVTPDYGKAREWYEKAADRGEASAMINLGTLYENGWGVAQDHAKARDLFEKAAHKGEATAIAILDRLRISEAAEEGHYAEALHLQAISASKVEAEETKRDGEPGQETARALDSAAWYALLARDFTEALAAADRAHALLPDDLSVETNRAHALMFLDHRKEAAALYLAHKGEPLSEADSKPWERAIADDFAEFRKAGLKHPLMADIEKKLGLAR